MSNDERASQNDSDATSSDEDSQPEAELMISTRERRKTAGNRYSQVVAQEQADEDEDDDVALLFAEAEGDDEEYNSDEADGEVDMSSSDDDDQGPNAVTEDMEGEKELEKQAKVDRQKKRKADMALTTLNGIRKKPKIDPTSLHRAPDKAKPSKRKERISWLPDEATMSGRTSLRKQTVAHREILLERLKENEEQRLKNKAIREEKEKVKQAEAPKEMTQADRLAEAEKNERRNAKSLNRWEAMEAQRAEDQAARLAALKDRKLGGAVLTFHSSSHVYRGPKVERSSPGRDGPEEGQLKKKGRKLKDSNDRQSTSSQMPTDTFVHSPFTNAVANSNRGTLASSTPIAQPIQPAQDAQATSNEWLAGIHEYASQPGTGQPTFQANQDNSSQHRVVQDKPDPPKVREPKMEGPTSEADLRRDKSLQPEPPVNEQPIAKPQDAPTVKLEPRTDQQGRLHGPSLEVQTTLTTTKLPDSLTGQEEVSSQGADPIVIQVEEQPQLHPPPSKPQTQPHVAAPPLDATIVSLVPEPRKPSPPPLIEITSTRNLLILDKFENLAADVKQDYSVFHGTKKAPKLTKHVTEVCAFTGLPAKYHDPTTGVPYANVAAFKKLRELQKHTYRWSSMLGCYVGRAGRVARGVPDGFLGRVQVEEDKKL